MNLRRITVEEVKDSYRRTGRYPISGIFQNSDRGCCPLAAVAKSERTMVPYRGRNEGAMFLPKLAVSMGLDLAYTWSFMDGYDMEDFNPGTMDKQGYADGFACRAEVPPVRDY